MWVLGCWNLTFLKLLVVHRNSFAFNLALLAFVFVSGTRAAVTFNCTYSEYYHSDLGETYECLAQVTTRGNPHVLKSVIGKHLPGKTLNDVTSLKIVEQNMPVIPNNIDLKLGNLSQLLIINSNLSKLTNEGFLTISTGDKFVAFKNEITYLPGNLLKNSNVKWFNASGNPIQHIGRNFLANAKHLLTADLRNSGCVSKYANTPEDLKNLGKLLAVSCPPPKPIATTKSTTPKKSTTKSTTPSTTKTTPTPPTTTSTGPIILNW